MSVSLKELFLQGNFYRRLGKQLNLALAREFVAPLHAKGGRPSPRPLTCH